MRNPENRFSRDVAQIKYMLIKANRCPADDLSTVFSSQLDFPNKRKYEPAHEILYGRPI